MKSILISLIVGTVLLKDYIDALNTVTGNVATYNFEAQVWTRDSSINITLGQDTVSYCKIEDPLGNILFENFGQCRIDLPRALDSHHGIWKMSVGYPEKITLEEHNVAVSIVTASTKPTVTTDVVKEDPVVILTCSLPAGHEVKACKFRDPSGNILVTHRNAVTDDRYAVETSDNVNSCSLKITSPVVSDLGLWRCGVETEEDAYYGFLTVLCPWAMQDPTVAASVVTEPVVSAQKTAVAAVEGDEVTLFCSIPASIRYCFFRSRNGTLFNVGTEKYSRNAQYFGSGLEAGECGIKFPAGLTDSGAWSCHVGFADADMEEQRLSINLEVNDLMVADQYISGNTLVVESRVQNSRALDYCRFVRIDGVGFTSTNTLPERYSSFTSLSSGHCAIHIADPTILDNHPWTVVSMIKGLDKEVSRYTDHTIQMGTPGHTEEEEELVGLKPGYMQMPHSCFWIGVFIFILFFISTMVLAIPKSRKWVVRKSAAVRFSMRKDSIEKPHLPVHDLPQNNAALPA